MSDHDLVAPLTSVLHDAVMSAMDRVWAFLGFKTVPTQSGYRVARDVYRRQVCERCGARVDPPEQQLHTRWHAQVGH